MEKEQQAKQWSVTDSEYRPIGTTAKKIEAGTYEFRHDGSTLYLNPINVISDNLIELPDPNCAAVLAGIKKFWTIERRYRDFGLLYKRSIGLYGPPGGGKTATVILIGRQLIAEDGLVIIFNDYTPAGLAMLRKIEPKRRIVCIMEDLDDIILCSESEVLSLLDGETQVDGVVYLATTNHFEKLPPTLANRPSRFDEWVFVKLPSRLIRKAYLQKVAGSLSEEELVKWARDTENFSVAHLKELATAVLCLEYPYDEVIERLRKMIENSQEASESL